MAVDSKQQKLSDADIMLVAAKESGINRPPKDILNMLKVEFSLPNTWKLREGNTIFVVHKTKVPGYGYFRALNADTAQNYLENSRIFIDAAYKAGYDFLVTQFENPSILNIFKAIGRDKPADMGFVVQRTNTGGYQVIVQAGKPRGEIK
jgi:hypothetical protein